MPRVSRRRHALLAGLFCLLLAAAAFVLLAKPLAISVTPQPDTLSIAGFPPVMAYGDRHLGLIGTYRLRAEKTGYQPLVREVEISRQGSRYQFTMEKLPGLIDATSTPPGATLLVDGTPVGTTPLSGQEIAAGSRTLRFELARYLPQEHHLEVEGFGNRASLEVTLEPAWARYTITSDPSAATVSVDGVEVGATPLEIELLAGQRHLRLTRPESAPLSIELTVTAGEDRTLPVFQLVPAPASVVISSEPAGATVTADGHYQGRTPTTITLTSATTHQLRLSAAGYQSASRSLVLAAGEERDLNITLEPEYGTLFIAATPPDATLLIDGKARDTATGRFRLPTRPHTLELKAAGYVTATRTVTPQAGYSQKIDITLERQGAAEKTAVGTQANGVRSTLGQRLVLITPRPFRMGAARTEPGRRANEIEHDVVLQRKFYLSEREVTNAEYRRYRARHSSGVAGRSSLDSDSHPVVNVSWDDAARFLNWLSLQDGLPPYYVEQSGRLVASDPRGIGYRLPTEAEWAFAARVAGRQETARYPWPGKFPPGEKAGNFADESARQLLPVVITGYRDGFAATAPTGSFPANPVGLYDLGGNVAEWCHDYYAANSGSARKGDSDPMGPEAGGHRVVRGSSWRDASITELRFSFRRYSREPADDIGFRVARYAE